MTLKRSALTLTAVFAVLGGLWIFRPYPTPPPALIEPRLLALREPLRSAEVGLITDGGSLWIELEDKEGKSESFFIPHRMMENQNYQTVFVVSGTFGTFAQQDAIRTEVAHSRETKQALVRLLKGYQPTSPQQEFGRLFGIERLGGRWVDSLHREWFSRKKSR